jgi:hypothetical protein
MAHAEAEMYCQTCQQQTLHRRKGPNHTFHLLIFLLTCGAWGVVWLVVAAQARPWLCSVCGSACRLSTDPIVPDRRVPSIRTQAWLLGVAAVLVFGMAAIFGLSWPLERAAEARAAEARKQRAIEHPDEAAELGRLGAIAARQSIEEEQYSTVWIGIFIAGGLGLSYQAWRKRGQIEPGS